MASAEQEFLNKSGRHAWSRAWWLAGIQIVTTALAMGLVTILPKWYESSTTIRIERSQMINPLVRGLAVSSESEDRLRSLREEILSRDYFEKIISRLALEPPGTPPLAHERRIQTMMKNTTLAGSRQAGTFQIIYRGESPTQVRDVTNLLAGIFIEDSLANKAGEAGAAVEFLNGQLEVYRKKLEEAEALLRQFEERNLDALPSNRAAHLARVEQLRATLMEVQSNLRQARMQRDYLSQQALSASGPGTEGTAPSGTLMVTNPVQALLQEKEAQLRRYLVDYSVTYPDVVALKAEIAVLQKELDKQPTVPAARAQLSRQPSIQDALSLGQLQQLEGQVAALSTREQQLTLELARFEKKVQALPEVEQEQTRLKRDYDVNNVIYNEFLRRLEEAKVSRELEASKRGEVYRILQAAALPLSPASPKRERSVLLGVAAGLGLNALLVILFAQNDTSIQSREEASKLLGLKVLAGIPRHYSKKQRSLMVLKAVLLSVTGLLYLVAVTVFLAWENIMVAMQRGY
jgi:polysaccharide chain length determinant protein (PEP-CTERM system associated)